MSSPKTMQPVTLPIEVKIVLDRAECVYETLKNPRHRAFHRTLKELLQLQASERGCLTQWSQLSDMLITSRSRVLKECLNESELKEMLAIGVDEALFERDVLFQLDMKKCLLSVEGRNLISKLVPPSQAASEQQRSDLLQERLKPIMVRAMGHLESEFGEYAWLQTLRNSGADVSIIRSSGTLTQYRAVRRHV